VLHWVGSFGSYVSYRHPDPPKGVRWTVLELDGLWSVVGIRCDRLQDPQKIITISSKI
jgi:hypothetical protein